MPAVTEVYLYLILVHNYSQGERIWSIRM